MSNRNNPKRLLERLIARVGYDKATEIAKKREKWIRAKAERKQAFLTRCSMQAKLHKAKLMLRDKGRNGRSMNDALVAAHGIQRKGEPTNE